MSVSPDLIGRVTDAESEEVKQGRQLPPEQLYPVLFFYALRGRIRDEGSVPSQSVYLALGIRIDGTRQVLGLWIKQNEGARFWLPVMNELKGRCMQDCLTAVVMGPKGLPQAMRSAFPEAGVQTCIVHRMWRGLSLCSHPECREMARHMQAI